MANKPINALPALDELQSDDLLAVWDSSLNTAVKMSGTQMVARLTEIAEGHGGIDHIAGPTQDPQNPLKDIYTIVYADGEDTTFVVTNGAKGDTGDQTFVWIAFSAVSPTSDADVSVIPAPWIGIYVGLESTQGNLHYTDYTWYEIKGPKGDGVAYTAKTGEVGLTSTYTMYTADGTPVGSFTVTNGSGAVSLVNGIAADGNGNVPAVVGSVSDLGLSVGSATIAGAFAALQAKQMLLAPATDFAVGELPLVGGNRVNDGAVEIFKGDGIAGWIEFHGRLVSVGDFRMFFSSSNVPTGTWVANGGDVDFSSLIYFNYDDPLNCMAVKRNGVVYLTVQSCSRVWAGDNSVCTIPAGFRPPTQIQFPASASAYNATVYIQAHDGDTKVGYIGAPASTNTRIIFTISYPV